METFTNDGLCFQVTDLGGVDRRAVVALHGFPQDSSCWDEIAAVLVGAGFRVLAPDQRGYAPSARPSGRAGYTVRRLAGDVLALADQAGVDRFDLVGHDWGAAVGWYLAGNHPDRVRSLSALSVPHPRAMLAAALRGTQLLRSWYMGFFQLPVLPEFVVAAGGADRLANELVGIGIDGAHAERYARRLAAPGGATGPLNWYRAIPLGLGAPSPPVEVPTMLIWSTGDRYVTRAAAEGCARWVRGPYRCEILDGSHWIPERQGRRAAALILEQLAAVPG